MDGFLNIDKPAGPTSFGVVSQIRKIAHEKKAGHAGTLDPKASGVLVIALGKATRLLPFLPIEPKTYAFTIQFGSETDTLDSAGEVIKRDGIIPSLAQIREILPRFTGPVIQTPPAYSAVKINGERAYDLARKKEPVETKPRQITIHAIDIINYDEKTGQAMMEVSCSSGTYVRAIARDMGIALGTCGYALSIRRTRVGNMLIDHSIRFENIESGLNAKLIDMRQALAHLPVITASPEQYDLLSHGQSIRIDGDIGTFVPVLVLDSNNALAAVVKHSERNIYQPVRVFIAKG